MIYRSFAQKLKNAMFPVNGNDTRLIIQPEFIRGVISYEVLQTKMKASNREVSAKYILRTISYSSVVDAIASVRVHAFRLKRQLASSSHDMTMAFSKFESCPRS